MLLQLSPQNGGVYVDATFGAGGYSEAILESADCKVYAIDRDETVVKFYDDLSVRYPNRVKLFIEKFSNIKSILSRIQIADTGIRKKKMRWNDTRQNY